MRRASTLSALALVLGCAADGAVESISFGDAGDEDPASLPECAGPLFREIYRATVPVLAGETVPPAFAVSSRSHAEPRVMSDIASVLGTVRHLVATAEHEVDLQTLGWTIHSTGPRVFLGALQQLERTRRAAGASDPVVVRVLLEQGTDAGDQVRHLRDAMIEAERALADLELDPRYVRTEVAGHLHPLDGTFEARTLVVDGRVALMTSASMNDISRLPSSGRDAAFVFEGDAALSLLAEFDDAWRESGVWSCGASSSVADGPADEEECFRYRSGEAHPIASNPFADACQTTLVAGRRWRTERTQDDLDHPQAQAFLAAIYGSRSKIRIRTSGLDEPAVEKALLHALVTHPALTVDLLLPKTDEVIAARLDPATATVASRLHEMLRGLGVTSPCKRLQVRYLSDDVDARHVRYASFDGQVAIVGSAALDRRSWNQAREVNVVIDDASVVAAWDDQTFATAFLAATPETTCP